VSNCKEENKGKEGLVNKNADSDIHTIYNVMIKADFHEVKERAIKQLVTFKNKNDLNFTNIEQLKEENQ
jgi:hypothetical protein